MVLVLFKSFVVVIVFSSYKRVTLIKLVVDECLRPLTSPLPSNVVAIKTQTNATITDSYCIQLQSCQIFAKAPIVWEVRLAAGA